MVKGRVITYLVRSILAKSRTRSKGGRFSKAEPFALIDIDAEMRLFKEQTARACEIVDHNRLYVFDIFHWFGGEYEYITKFAPNRVTY
mgnify:CR=1 FL=1